MARCARCNGGIHGAGIHRKPVFPRRRFPKRFPRKSPYSRCKQGAGKQRGKQGARGTHCRVRIEVRIVSATVRPRARGNSRSSTRPCGQSIPNSTRARAREFQTQYARARAGEVIIGTVRARTHARHLDLLALDDDIDALKVERDENDQRKEPTVNM